jgi:hypothetical protein
LYRQIIGRKIEKGNENENRTKEKKPMKQLYNPQTTKLTLNNRKKAQ